MKAFRSYIPLLLVLLCVLLYLFYRSPKASSPSLSSLSAPLPSSPCLGTFYPTIKSAEEILFTHVTDKVRFRIGKDLQFNIFTELLQQLYQTRITQEAVQENILGYLHFKGPQKDIILGLGDTRLTPVLDTDGNPSVQFLPSPKLASFLSQLWKYGSTVSYPKIASHLQAITFPPPS